MGRDDRLMAGLSARLLESQKKVGESAEATELRQSGENSILGSLDSVRTFPAPVGSRFQKRYRISLTRLVGDCQACRAFKYAKYKRIEMHNVTCKNIPYFQ